MPIQLLSDSVAAQIAAGEVIERPVSVVKELLENALDAGASYVRIEIEGGGRRLIRITDNGCGIPRDETELAFERHATSKLLTLDDLYNIHTLGFRGEALASVATVSQVTLITRTDDEASGTLLRLDAGRIVEQRSVGTPVGTVITVENLFFNTPVRLKFLKAETAERRQIDTLVTRYAMAYPGVRFSLIQDGRETFTTAGTGSLADVLIEALGMDTMREMLPVKPTPRTRPDLPQIDVYGYVSAPHVNRNTRSHITLFINGRHVQDSSLTFAVSQAYHTLMPADRHPIAVLMITLPPAEMDVNVHPAKAEVRFQSPDAVFSAVQRAVRHAVVSQAPIPPTGQYSFGAARDEEAAASGQSLPPQWRSNQGLYTARDAAGDQLGFDLPDYDAGRRVQQSSDGSLFTVPQGQGWISEAERHAVPGMSAGNINELAQRPRTLPPLRVIGQVAACYIVAEGPAGMYLIDQHAAHERILYEQFMQEARQHETLSQQTLDTITVELAPDAARLVEANLASLNAVGFEIETFGTHTFKVRAVPSILAKRGPEESVAAILEDLEIGAEPGASTLEAQIILRVCKAAAVKAGQVLSYDEMQAIIRQLERCASPRSCPHGRPTMLHMSADQLAKEFGRT